LKIHNARNGFKVHENQSINSSIFNDYYRFSTGYIEFFESIVFNFLTRYFIIAGASPTVNSPSYTHGTDFKGFILAKSGLLCSPLWMFIFCKSNS